MWPNPQFAADLVTIIEEILNEKLNFLCSVGVLHFCRERRQIDKSKSRYLASKLSHMRIECVNTWPLAHIFWHFAEIQHDYIDHAFLAFSQNVPWVFIRVILIIAVILFTEFKAWAQYLVFIKTAGFESNWKIEFSAFFSIDNQCNRKS